MTQIKAIRQLTRENKREAIPAMIDLMDSDEATVRAQAFEGVKELSGQKELKPKYESWADADNRKPAIEAWRAWWTREEIRLGHTD